MKVCSRCKEEKSLADFHNKSKSKDGKQSHCKKCGIASAKAWNRANPDIYKARSSGRHASLRRHGLSVEEWDEYLEKIDHRCEICGTQSDSLYVDHDHDSGMVRGALCTHCNRGLGAFYDDPQLLRKAASFVKNPPLRWMKKISRVSTPSKLPHEWKPGRKPRGK